MPPGVEIVETVYDRSDLIKRSIDHGAGTLVEQFVVVALICIVFLFHLRSAFVAIIALPLGVLAAFIVMRYQGITANIVSLGGIAIAIGEMVDARGGHGRERAPQARDRRQEAHPGARRSSGEARWKVITDAAVEVGPALFFSRC